MISSLDTSIIVRLCTADSAAHLTAANKLLQSASQVAIADAAIIETEHVLRTWYAYDRERIIDTFAALLWQDNINCNRTLFDKALHYYKQYPSESFVDCCLTVYAELDQTTPLLTFDKNLAKHLPNATLLPTA